MHTAQFVARCILIVISGQSVPRDVETSRQESPLFIKESDSRKAHVLFIFLVIENQS